MGLQHVEPVPKSFGDAVSGTYLGDAAVVGRLVGQFLVDTEGDLYAMAGGQLLATAFQDALSARIRAAGEVFSHDSEQYQPVLGYHGEGGSMQPHIVAALDGFWGPRRARWDDDAACCLFEWLALQLVRAWKTSDGDDAVLEAAMRPHVAAARSLLQGTRIPA